MKRLLANSPHGDLFIIRAGYVSTLYVKMEYEKVDEKAKRLELGAGGASPYKTL